MDKRIQLKPQAVDEQRYDSLELVFQSEKAKYKVGQPISLKLSLRNLGDKVTTITFRSSQTHDFVIKDEEGRVIWRWSDGRMFAQALVDKELRPGKQLTYTAKWEQRDTDGLQVTSGSYTVEGMLNVTDLRSLSIEINIE